MDKIVLDNLTDQQLKDIMSDLNEKFRKLRNLASKIAEEMDNISEQYQEIISEIEKRKTK